MIKPSQRAQTALSGREREGVGRVCGGEIAVVMIVGCSNISGWGRGVCVTMWREKERVTPAAEVPSPVSSEGWLSSFSEASAPQKTHHVLFASSGGFALYASAFFEDLGGRCFLSDIYTPEKREGRQRRPTGRVLRLDAPRRSADGTPDQTLRTERFGGQGVERENIAEWLLTSTNVAFIVAFASSHSTVLNVLTSVQS